MTLATQTLEGKVGETRRRGEAPEAGSGRGAGGGRFHRPVLAEEVVAQLGVRAEGVYLDATVGEGGHALAILRASAPGGRVLGIDLDPRSLAMATERLGQFGQRFVPAHGNYTQMAELARSQGIDQVDGVLLDLGFSSRQVEAAGYGFSFRTDEPLDMRYDPEGQTLTAAHIVNTYSEAELARTIFQYGEEPRSRAIARAIVQNRPIESTLALADLVAKATGGRRGHRLHPATRTFQALRIEVNAELDNLEAGLRAAVGLLAPAGRLVVISYHSLEDRLVKTFLGQESRGCVCPPEVLVCICGRQPVLRLVNRRIIRPSQEEAQANPRSRSARMRVAQRL